MDYAFDGSSTKNPIASHPNFADPTDWFAKKNPFVSAISVLNDSNTSLYQKENPFWENFPDANSIDELKPSIQLKIDPWEGILRDLESLESSEDFIAPSRSTLRDFEALVRIVQQSARLPDVEHDDSSGFLSLRWYSEAHRSMFSMTFPGTGEVVATLMPPSAGRQGVWKLKTRDEIKFLELLAEPSVRQATA